MRRDGAGGGTGLPTWGVHLGSLPGRDCPLCPRLAAFRADSRAANPGWFNAPVPSFGGLDARLLVVGLAPGVRGANRTAGRSPAITRVCCCRDAVALRLRRRGLRRRSNDGLALTIAG